MSSLDLVSNSSSYFFSRQELKGQTLQMCGNPWPKDIEVSVT